LLSRGTRTEDGADEEPRSPERGGAARDDESGSENRGDGRIDTRRVKLETY
jgi:hypothetical protein